MRRAAWSSVTSHINWIMRLCRPARIALSSSSSRVYQRGEHMRKEINWWWYHCQCREFPNKKNVTGDPRAHGYKPPSRHSLSVGDNTKAPYVDLHHQAPTCKRDKMRTEYSKPMEQNELRQTFFDCQKLQSNDQDSDAVAQGLKITTSPWHSESQFSFNIWYRIR